MERHDLSKSLAIQKQASEFLDFVIKEWVCEMKTETSISYEFIDKRERDTFTSDYAFQHDTIETRERDTIISTVNEDLEPEPVITGLEQQSFLSTQNTSM